MVIKRFFKTYFYCSQAFIKTRISIYLWNSSLVAISKSIQSSFQRPKHCRNYMLRIKLTRSQIIVNSHYFLLAYISCIKAFVSPKPSRSRYWFTTFVSPFNCRSSSAIGQRRRMKNQCPERRFIYLLLCQLFIQQRRNGNIGKCAI